MWTYVQSTGELLQDGVHIDTGYSGKDEGKNNPAMQAVHNMGPIPQGAWTIVGPPVNTPAHGPFVLHLQNSPQTNTFGRDEFLMHGDSIAAPGTASEGCIIMPRVTREKVWASNDTDLEVVAALPAPDSGADA